MFRIPNEHFSAIADIAGQPEAPNVISKIILSHVHDVLKTNPFQEPSDIVLAAFAQIQSLTETLNDYIKVSAHQEISAVSTALCDECIKLNSTGGGKILKSKSDSNVESIEMTTATSTTITESSTLTTVQTEVPAAEQAEPITDDDGYCEIDEIRLPALFLSNAGGIISSTARAVSPEFKRHSTISADSIPEETEQEVNVEMFHSVVSSDNGDDASDSINKPCDDEHIEINETYDSTSQQVTELNPDNQSLKDDISCIANAFSDACAANRLAHATSIAPSVPCHLISSHVTALSMQISQLLVRYIFFRISFDCIFVHIFFLLS